MYINRIIKITIMKGQAELIIFILLFIISIVLFTAATVWSRGIFQQNVDVAKLEAAEKFMKDLDKDISNVIKFGGSKEIEYNLDGTIEIVDDKTIEVRTPISLPLQKNWINISSDTSFIQEIKEGDDLVLQLIYPQKDYKVEFIPGGPKLAQPTYIKIEKSYAIETIIQIKVTFV
jgi:hypothetical protein